ncbi:hypothetical protein [Nocardia puris]|uniref:hypothetical protein n=1 Tax=Nocardia puris TaxID=208602 RepID=UPI002E1BA6CE
MSYRVQYTRPPDMHITHTCSGIACGTGTIAHDGDSFVCSDCGTSWADENDDGQLHDHPTDLHPIDPDGP